MFLPLLARAQDTPSADSGDTAWLITATALVLFMTLPGLALFYAGLVRAKNVLSILMQCFAITGVVSLMWLAVGYSLTFADGSSVQPFIGSLDRAFLELPRPVVETPIRRHQRCFTAERPDGSLAPFFVAISNMPGRDPAEIRRGNERVIGARHDRAGVAVARRGRVPEDLLVFRGPGGDEGKDGEEQRDEQDPAGSPHVPSRKDERFGR